MQTQCPRYILWDFEVKQTNTPYETNRSSLLPKILSLNYVTTLTKRKSYYDFCNTPSIVLKDYPMEVVKLGLKDYFLLNS